MPTEALLLDPWGEVLTNGGMMASHATVSGQFDHEHPTADTFATRPSGRGTHSLLCNQNTNNNNNNSTRKRHHEAGADSTDDTQQAQHSRRKRRHRGPRPPKGLRQRVLDFDSVARPIPNNAIQPSQIYGDGVGPKPDGVFRLAYGNIDGFSTVAFNNPKGNLL
jgi:hypothetical protein